MGHLTEDPPSTLQLCLLCNLYPGGHFSIPIHLGLIQTIALQHTLSRLSNPRAKLAKYLHRGTLQRHVQYSALGTKSDSCTVGNCLPTK